MYPSRRHLGLLALALTGALISFTWLRPKPAPRTESAAPVASPTPVSLTLRQIVAAPLAGTRSSESETSLACAAFAHDLLGLAVEDLDYPPRATKLPNPHDCAPADGQVARIVAHYAEKCAGPIAALPGADVPKEKWEATMAECQLALLMARSTLAVASRPKRAIAEIDDLRELADLLISSFGRLFTAKPGDASGAGLGEMREVADRMVALDPSLIPAHKAGAMATMLESVQAKESGGKDPIDWAALEERVREIRERSPADADIDTLDRIAKTEGMDPERVKQDSLSRLAARPDDWRENQVLAWANWKLGRKDEARTALRRALDLAPDEPELRENWRVVEKPGSRPDDFKVSMRVGLDFNALLK